MPYDTTRSQGGAIYHFGTSATLINYDLMIGLPFALLFIGVSFYRYKNSLRHFARLKFWLQFALITIVAAIFWEGLKTQSLFSVHGLMIGLKMNLRALVIIIGFSCISTELRNPVVKSLLHKNGATNLYQALRLSFSSLPTLIALFPKKDMFKKRKELIPKLLLASESLLQYFETNNIKKIN